MQVKLKYPGIGKTEGNTRVLFVPHKSLPLPTFKYGCPTRTEIVRNFLEKNGCPNVGPHSADDFTVEIVESNDFGEVWHLGS